MNYITKFKIISKMSQFKKTDLFKVPFTSMDIVEGNRREDYGDIRELAQSILEDIQAGGEGIKVPMEGYFKDGRLKITRGHRRYAAMELVYKEHGIDVVARVTSELRGTTEEQRLLDQYLTNNGKPFTPLEQAHIVDELMTQFKYNATKVAKRLGKTEAYISRLRLLLKAPQPLINLINEGKMKATLVMDIVRDNRVEEVLAKIESGKDLTIEQDTTEEENTDGDGKKIRPVRPARENITRGDIDTVNSWKEFKKAAVFIDIKRVAPEKQPTLKFLFQLMNDELNQDQIKRYFKNVKD